MSQNIPISEEENNIANEESRYIFGYLRKKYCNENVRDLDIVLNSLCFALLRLIHINVIGPDRKAMVKIIAAILEKGVNEDAP